jgi:hypothetical protein
MTKRIKQCCVGCAEIFRKSPCAVQASPGPIRSNSVTRGGEVALKPEENDVKQSRNELPTRLEAGGVCIQSQDWGDTNVARIRFPKGADATPLLEGMPDDLCPCPHWGTVLKGSIHVRYADGTEETVRAGEVYYWPPGHTVWVDEDYEAVEFSPSGEMGELIEHLKSKLET